ncbi:DNA topoisomerase 2-binding protein 1-like [Liolophura sinensis]|uniref:DNA topoisomerase 2-binding protein 1-like n=1 Tax=Liolophura sinensis TaxID=3198878 RepID=UPI003158626E
MGDEEFQVKCVKPSEEDDENNPGSGVETAYDIMLENGFHPVWVSKSDCLKVKERQKNCVYIIDPFRGNAFEHLASIGCRVFGPQCVLSCLHLKVGIPKRKVPIYSLAMKDLIISCTSLDKKTREDVMQKVQWMGGEVSKDFTEYVTHLVAGEVGSKKYIVAGGLGKHIMSPEWVEQVWNKGKNRHLHGTDEQFQKWKCPIFKNMVITVSGLDSEKRKQVKSLVEAEGGSYSGEMKVNECTHLIIKEPKGQKYEFARKWKIQIVSLKWLSDSVEKGFCQDEEQYRVESAEGVPQRAQVSTSTPDKDKKGKGQRLSSLNDISSISHLPDLSHLNETAQTNLTRLTSTDEVDSLLELDLSKYPAELFLDGCRIYLSGFRGPQLEKLRKIINCGGATRFNQINDSVTHVVIGEKISTDLKTLQQASFRPHVVTASWLVESLKCGKLQDEKKFYCLQLPPLESASAKPKVVKCAGPDTPSVKETANHTEDEDREMAELMSQYMRQQTDITVQPEGEVTVAEPVENSGDVTQEPVGAGAQDGGIFSGKKFIFLGFEDDQQAELAGYTEEHGGKVVSGGSRQVCDYAIVPIGGYPVTVTVTDVLTNAWLQMCLEQEELLCADDNELFHPLEIVDENSPLDGCVLSISGFSGTERDCLMHIAEVLGARCQEYFVRKANNKDNKGLAASTHLITKEAGGSKYTAAKKWKLPAVSKQWLFACARSGKQENEGDYLIDNVKTDSTEPATSGLTNTDNPNLVAPPAQHDIQNGQNTHADKRNKDKRDSLNNGEAEKLQASNDEQSDEKCEVFDQRVDIVNQETELPEENDAPVAQGQPHSGTDCPDVPFPNDDYADMTLPREHIPDVPQPPVIHVSPPGGSSQKENQGAQYATPIITRPQHGRVKELAEHGHAAGNVRTPGTAARMGIDTPSKFLNPQKTYNPNFDLNEFMLAVESPMSSNTPCGKKAGRRRKSSLPLEEAIQFHMSVGMKNSTMCRADNAAKQRGEQDGDSMFDDKDFSKFPVLDQNKGPLRGVVIAVSKKLSNHQAEYNNMAASLGADYRWTYDKSCTHFIFQGRPNDINKEFRTAREHGKLVVSPHWLTMCKEQNARVDESLFPHNYNPNLSLSVVSGKRDTPARSTRKSSRNALRSQAQETPKSTKPRALSTDDVPAKFSKSDDLKNDTAEKVTPVEKSPPVSGMGDNVLDEESKVPLLDMGGTLEIREAFNNKIMNIMATTNFHLSGSPMAESMTKKTPRRKSRRQNSSGVVDSENSSTDSVGRSRTSARNRQRTSPEEKVGSGQRKSRRSSKHSEQSNPEPSQSVQVTWDDETGRLEQERLAVELQRAHSPTQCSQAYPPGLEFDENAQFSDLEKDDSMEIQFNTKAKEDKSSKKSGEFRTPTPEPPSLGFPIAQANQKEPEPIELIEEEGKEGEDDPAPPPPVFIVSGMQQQERDDYGALVEQLGGRMLEGQHYDSSCTHLVVGNPTRNEKFLACVASGKWVLHKSYFEACRQEGHFVQEEVHEWGSDGTRIILANSSALTMRLAVAAHRWRIRIQDSIKANQSCRGAFEGWKVVLCTDKNKEENFKRLLEAGGAQVVATRPPFSSSLDATHAFLDLHKIKLSQDDLEQLLHDGVNCLRPDYIASFLTEDPPPNPDESCPTEVMALKASISGPEQTARKRKASSTSDSGKRSRRV